MRPLTSMLSLVIVVSLITLGCATDEGQPSNFHVTFSELSWVEATGGRCPVLTVTLTGPGEAAPFGPFTLSASHCMTVGSADSYPELTDSIVFPTVTDGQFAFNFPSGATMTGTYQGNLVLVENGLYKVFVDFLITGGTRDGPLNGAANTVDDVARLNRHTGQLTNLSLGGGSQLGGPSIRVLRSVSTHDSYP